MAKRNYENRLKQAIQLTIIGVIVILMLIPLFKPDFVTDFEAYCPFGGLMTLGSKYWLGSMSCQMSETQIFMGLALIIGVMLFGKLFCGYLCPIGSAIEWLQKGATKLKLKVITLRGWPDRILRVLKYAILYFTAYYSITSSELFCKKFDPYYGITSGFDHDTVLWWSVTALIIVLGSVFIRFFWCKYLCPLSALSNIGANFLVSVPILAIYLAIRWAGIDVHIAWLLGALSVSGAATEVIRFKFYDINPFKITIYEPQCTHCSLCDVKCPQGIEVNSYEKVDHPDCTLCMDCVKTCPQKGGIGLWRWKSTWIPPVIIVVLIALALLISRNFEFATLTERWGNFEKIENVQSIRIDGLRSVKCFGSASSLKNKMMRKKGIVGLDAYAKNHHVLIYFDPAVLDSMGVKRAVFSPSKYKVHSPAPDVASIAVLKTGVYELFDGYDNYDLYYMLAKLPGVFAFRTEFGEPVLVDVYYDSNIVTPEQVVETIKAGEYEKVTEGKSETVNVKFETNGQIDVLPQISFRDFVLEFFPAVNQTFNNYDKYEMSALKTLEFGMPEAENSQFTRQISYFVSHLSEYDGIVRFCTDFTDRAVGIVYFDPAQVDSLKIVEKIKAPMMKVFLKDGSTKDFENPFHAVEPYRIVSATKK